MEDTIDQTEYELKYDNDREKELGMPKVEKIEIDNSEWLVNLKEQSEELQQAIGSDEYSIEQAEKRVKKNKEKLKSIEHLIAHPPINF